MNFTDEERQELEAQYEDVDPKLIQIQMLMELSQIRMALTQSQSESESTQYRCESCGGTVKADKRQRHAMQEHNAPEMPAEDLGLFEAI
jgi:hypothetical protein